MKTIRIRGCELLHDTKSGNGNTLEPQSFPVAVLCSTGTVVCNSVQELASLLWSEPDAARVFTTESECRWYVENWCQPFGKQYTRQDNRPQSCMLQMYGNVAF